MSRINVNLDVEARFFDPNPGFAGASIPIPAQVKEVADSLNRKVLTVREAVKKIRAVTDGEISVYDDAIMLIIEREIGTKKDKEKRRHSFRVISFKKQKNY